MWISDPRDTKTFPTLIVVADADRANRELLCRALRDAGHEAVEADSVEALGALLSVLKTTRHPVDLVIADVSMTGLDRIPIGVPLIAMVSAAGTVAQAAALRAAANVHRPIFVDEVQQTVKRLAGRKRRVARTSAPRQPCHRPPIQQAVLSTWS